MISFVLTYLFIGTPVTLLLASFIGGGFPMLLAINCVVAVVIAAILNK